MLQTQQDILAAKLDVQATLLGIPGVHCVGIGSKSVKGNSTNTIAIVVGVEKKLPIDQLEQKHVIPAEMHGFPTDVFELPRTKSVSPSESAEPEKEDDDQDIKAYLPLAGGCRIIAQQHDHSGTCGLIVRAPSGKPAILSNKHVLRGGEVYQPKRNQFAVAYTSEQAQDYDCAYAELNPGVPWTNSVIDIGPIQGSYNVTAADLRPNYHVRKRGKQTGLSDMRIIAIEVSSIDENGALVGPDLLVEGAGEGGDSGAVLVDDQYRVVGMLRIKISDYAAYAIPIEKVCSSLGVSIYTDNHPALHMVHQKEDRCYEAVCRDNRWSSDVLIHPQSPYLASAAPTVQAFRNELVNLRQLSDTNIWAARFTDNEWKDDAKAHPTDNPDNFYRCGFSPAAINYDNDLVCIYKGPGDTNDLHYIWVTPEYWWSQEKKLAPTDFPSNYYESQFQPVSYTHLTLPTIYSV